MPMALPSSVALVVLNQLAKFCSTHYAQVCCSHHDPSQNFRHQHFKVTSYHDHQLPFCELIVQAYACCCAYCLCHRVQASKVLLRYSFDCLSWHLSNLRFFQMPSSYFFTVFGTIDSKLHCLSLNAKRLVAAPLDYGVIVVYLSSLEFLTFEFMKVMLFLTRFVLYALSKL